MPLAVNCQPAGHSLYICRSTDIQVCTMLLDGIPPLQDSAWHKRPQRRR